MSGSTDDVRAAGRAVRRRMAWSHHRRIDGHGGPVHLRPGAKSAEKRPGDLEPDLSTLVVAKRRRVLARSSRLRCQAIRSGVSAARRLRR